MKLNNILEIAGFLTILSVLAGCEVAFRVGHLQPITSWPPKATNTNKTISLIVTINENPVLSEQVVNAYSDADLFSYVKTGYKASEYRAEIKIKDRTDYPYKNLNLVSILTVLLIPMNGYQELIVTTTFTDKKGNKLGKIVKSEELDLCSQLFLIFAMPFNWPDTIAQEVLYDLNRATINEALNLGYFKPDKSEHY